MDVMQITANPATDKLLAERFLIKGSWYESSGRSDHVIVHDDKPWMPSSDPMDALRLVGNLMRNGYTVSLDMTHKYVECFIRKDAKIGRHTVSSLKTSCGAETLALAIARAFLSLPE